MNIQEELTKLLSDINFQLSGEDESFIYSLHENTYFDEKLFGDIIIKLKSIKVISQDGIDTPISFNINISQKITYMYDFLVDLYEHKNKFNLDKKKYYSYILEFKYEFYSLYDEKVLEDYHGNAY